MSLSETPSLLDFCKILLVEILVLAYSPLFHLIQNLLMRLCQL